MYESGKNYLETIYYLQKEMKEVHSIDVAKALSYSKPSVSRAMGNLKKEGMIEISEKGVITLTKEGQKTAKSFESKLDVLTRFLLATADTSVEVATKEAEKMSYYIQEETYKGIVAFMKKVES